MKYLILALLLPYSYSLSAGEMFKWTDKDGTVHFSDKKPAHADAQAVKPKPKTQYFAKKEEPKEEKPVTDTLIMYSASWCGHCKRARAFLNNNNVDFIEKDIDHSKEALLEYQVNGGQGTPFFVYNDKTLSGFNAHSFMKYYIPLVKDTNFRLSHNID